MMITTLKMLNIFREKQMEINVSKLVEEIYFTVKKITLK